MENFLINQIEKQKFNNKISVLLLVYINQNNINTTDQLIVKLLNSYIEQFNNEGYIYCIYNEVYKMYGENVYKLGCSKNAKKRLCAYTSYYINPCVIKHESQLIKYHNIAESILFIKLQQYRVSSNREFFNCTFEIIKETITEIENEILNTPLIDILVKYNLKFDKVNIFKDLLQNMVTKYKELFKNILIYDIIDNKCKKIGTTECKFIKIFNSKDLIETKFNKLSKNNFDEMTLDKRFELEKYIIKKHCNGVFDIEYIKNNYENINMKINHNFFNNNDIFLRNSKKWNDKKIIIKELILGLGFEVPLNNKTMLDRNIFILNIKKVTDNCGLFTNIDRSKELFKIEKGKIENAKTVKGFLGFTNTLLKEWGMKIQAVKIRKNICVNNKWTTNSVNKYNLVYTEN